MRLFWWTHEIHIPYDGRQLQSEVCLSIQLISVFCLCHNLSRKSRFTKGGGWKRQQFSNSTIKDLNLAPKLERQLMENLCFKTESLAMSINCSYHWLRSLPSEMREWKDFSANYCHYCWVENISQTSFESAWDAQLYDVLHLDAAWLYSSRYSFIISKTIKCILLHTLVPRCTF